MAELHQRVVIHEDMNLGGWGAEFLFVMSQGSIPSPDIFFRNMDDTQKAGILNL